MNVPFVDLNRCHAEIDSLIQKAVCDVIEKTAFIQGPAVGIFEKEFAAFCGKRFGVGVASGTDALMLSLMAYGIKGAEVITVANTFVATALSIKNSGNIPVFVDCDKTGNIDVTKIKPAITPRTKAIIPVHLYGQPADMDKIVGIAKKHSLVVIEDCCQAHGAEFAGKRVPFCETGGFSFYPAKNLGCFGDGGLVATDNEQIFSELKKLREYGSTVKYVHDGADGFNSRLDTVQAAVLSVKLAQLDKWNALRQEAAAQYIALLKDVSQVVIPAMHSLAQHVYHLFTILVSQRDELQQFLKTNGIQTGIHYPIPIHLQKMFAYLGHKQGDFPCAEMFAKQTLSLPMFPGMTGEEILFVCNKIKEFYSK